jgi:hypothetical protein
MNIEVVSLWWPRVSFLHCVLADVGLILYRLYAGQSTSNHNWILNRRQRFYFVIYHGMHVEVD